MATLNTLPDGKLVDLLKSGDHGAFTEIYNRYWDKLYTTAYNRLSDELEAEEAVQNIFLSLWKRKDALTLSHSLATYLSVSVKYQIFTRLAQQKRERQRTDELKLHAIEGKETTGEWLSERELRRQIEQTINTLPVKCRIVFQMSRDQHLTNKQIAEELSISEKTVEGHITKALTNLRGSLNVTLPVLLTILENKLHH